MGRQIEFKPSPPFSAEQSEDVATDTIIRILKGWIDWTKYEMERDGLETTDETSVSVDAWPSIGTMKNWIKHLTKIKHEQDFPDCLFKKQG